MAKCSVEMYSNKMFSVENLLFTFDKCIVIKLMLMHSATYTLHKYTCTTLLLCAHTHTHTHTHTHSFKLWEGAVQCLAVLDALISLATYRYT